MFTGSPDFESEWAQFQQELGDETLHHDESVLELRPRSTDLKNLNDRLQSQSSNSTQLENGFLTDLSKTAAAKIAAHTISAASTTATAQAKQEFSDNLKMQKDMIKQRNKDLIADREDAQEMMIREFEEIAKYEERIQSLKQKLANIRSNSKSDGDPTGNKTSFLNESSDPETSTFTEPPPNSMSYPHHLPSHNPTNHRPSIIHAVDDGADLPRDSQQSSDSEAESDVDFDLRGLNYQDPISR